MSFGADSTEPYVQVGRSGLFVYRIGLGTMQFGWSSTEAESCEVLDAYVAGGGNFIDTADCYSSWSALMGGPPNAGGVSEEIVGRWMRSRGNRDDLVIATKVRAAMGEQFSDHRGTFRQREGLSRRWIMRACEDSLRRLGVDHIDVYQAHFIDPMVPIEETMAAFTDLVRQGKVRYLGCSNWSAWRLVESLWASDRLRLESFISVQPEYSLLAPVRGDVESELTGACVRYGIGLLPYSPLGGGVLTGKYRRGAPLPDSLRAEENETNRLSDRNLDIVEAVVGVAEELGISPAAVAVNWLRTRPCVAAPIIGANTPAQLAAVLDGLDTRLTPDHVEILDRASDFRRSRPSLEQ